MVFPLAIRPINSFHQTISDLSSGEFSHDKAKTHALEGHSLLFNTLIYFYIDHFTQIDEINDHCFDPITLSHVQFTLMNTITLVCANFLHAPHSIFLLYFWDYVQQP